MKRVDLLLVEISVAVYYSATLIYLSAGRDTLLCFVPRALLMGNNATMIRAIIPLHPELARSKQKDDGDFALRLQPLHH